jgi:hypothetical protein
VLLGRRKQRKTQNSPQKQTSCNIIVCAEIYNYKLYFRKMKPETIVYSIAWNLSFPANSDEADQRPIVENGTEWREFFPATH